MAAVLALSDVSDDALPALSSPDLLGRRVRTMAAEAGSETGIRIGGLVIDESTYMATIRGRMLNLIY